jgi:hypothetical protein
MPLHNLSSLYHVVKFSVLYTGLYESGTLLLIVNLSHRCSVASWAAIVTASISDVLLLNELEVIIRNPS